LKFLYKQQNGICPICGKRITVEQGYCIHQSGDNEGRILVHRECDRKLHTKSSHEPALLWAELISAWAVWRETFTYGS
jgi:RNA-directed DNA polymerase